MTIGELINALLDVPAEMHHLAAYVMDDATYILPVTFASAYDLESPVGADNPFVIEFGAVTP